MNHGERTSCRPGIQQGPHYGCSKMMNRQAPGPGGQDWPRCLTPDTHKPQQTRLQAWAAAPITTGSRLPRLRHLTDGCFQGRTGLRGSTHLLLPRGGRWAPCGEGLALRVAQSALGAHFETGACGEDVLVEKGGLAVWLSRTHQAEQDKRPPRAHPVMKEKDNNRRAPG